LSDEALMHIKLHESFVFFLIFLIQRVFDIIVKMIFDRIAVGDKIWLIQND